uniref:Uncharacterized protein n=1 Tax=Anopheles farauti TaxID=69004 RepID=A0A182QMF9_9DIPT
MLQQQECSAIVRDGVFWHTLVTLPLLARIRKRHTVARRRVENVLIADAHGVPSRIGTPLHTPPDRKAIAGRRSESGVDRSSSMDDPSSEPGDIGGLCGAPSSLKQADSRLLEVAYCLPHSVHVYLALASSAVFGSAIFFFERPSLTKNASYV